MSKLHISSTGTTSHMSVQSFQGADRAQ